MSKALFSTVAGVATLSGIMALVLFAGSPLWVVPMVSFFWLLVLREKGYMRYAFPIFALTNMAFFIWPELWTGFAAVASMIVLSALPARKMANGRWQLASKDGSWKTWWLPNNSQQDVGAVVGDASIHVVVFLGLAIFLGVQLGF